MKHIEFNFPRTRFADENTAGQQLDHMMSEVEEIREACEDESIPIDDIVMEIADLTHSLETYWRIMIAQRGKKYVANIFDKVIEKNANRNYYSLQKKL